MSIIDNGLRFEVLQEDPTTAIATDVLSPLELARLLDCYTNRHWLAGQQIQVKMDAACTSFELLQSTCPELWNIYLKVKEVLHINAAEIQSIQMRNLKTADAFTQQSDLPKNDNPDLLYTAVLFLQSAEGDDKNHAFKPNTLAFRINYSDDGSEVTNTVYESLGNIVGPALIATYLFYGDKNEVTQVRDKLLAASPTIT